MSAGHPTEYGPRVHVQNQHELKETSLEEFTETQLDDPAAYSNYAWKIFDHQLRRAAAFKYKGSGFNGSPNSDSRDLDILQPLKQWIPAQGHPQLFDLLRNGIRGDIWEHCVEGHRAFDRDFLLGLPSEDTLDFPGWYLIVLYDDEYPNWWRVYVGQSVSVSRRWAAYTRALHAGVQGLRYALWRTGAVSERGTHHEAQAKCIRLGRDLSSFPNTLGMRNFPNMGELFFMLVFQSLQVDDLTYRLPKDVEINLPHRAANMSVPITDRHLVFPCAKDLFWWCFVGGGVRTSMYRSLVFGSDVRISMCTGLMFRRRRRPCAKRPVPARTEAVLWASGS